MYFQQDFKQSLSKEEKITGWESKMNEKKKWQHLSISFQTAATNNGDTFNINTVILELEAMNRGQQLGKLENWLTDWTIF